MCVYEMIICVYVRWQHIVAKIWMDNSICMCMPQAQVQMYARSVWGMHLCVRVHVYGNAWCVCGMYTLRGQHIVYATADNTTCVCVLVCMGVLICVVLCVLSLLYLTATVESCPVYNQGCGQVRE